MSMAKSSNSEQESISGESVSCSGVSLTAAVLTHAGHQEDSTDDTTTAVVSQQPGGGEEGERERGGKGRKRVPFENREGGEGSGVLPSRAVRRRSRHSPSKKRESE